MSLTRRELLVGGLGTVGVVGYVLLRMPGAGRLVRADEPEGQVDVPLLWMATGSCTGCSVTLLNSGSPNLGEMLLAEILPDKHLSLGFHATVMAASGQQAIDALHDTARRDRGRYVLVVEGATATKADGLYCCVGEEEGRPITGYEHVVALGRDALAVLAVGSCAAFGGIPAAGPNPTGAASVREIFAREEIATPLVNIPGCPPHPHWIVGTIATLLLGGLEALKLDAQLRPAPFFAETVHERCSRRGAFERGEFAERFGEPGCLLKLGCKGPVTLSDCPVRRFNRGISSCCEAGHPCIGCCHPDFPFERSLFAFDHAITGQALDENHAEIDCRACHTENRYDHAPTCVECHEEESGIRFPAFRPGPQVSGIR